MHLMHLSKTTMLTISPRLTVRVLSSRLGFVIKIRDLLQEKSKMIKLVFRKTLNNLIDSWWILGFTMTYVIHEKVFFYVNMSVGSRKSNPYMESISLLPHAFTRVFCNKTCKTASEAWMILILNQIFSNPYVEIFCTRFGISFESQEYLVCGRYVHFLLSQQFSAATFCITSTY